MDRSEIAKTTYRIPRTRSALARESRGNPGIFVGVVPDGNTDASFNGLACRHYCLVILRLLRQKCGLNEFPDAQFVRLHIVEVHTVEGSVILISNSVIATSTPKATNCSRLAWRVVGTSPTIRCPWMPIPSMGTPSACSCLTRLTIAVDFAPVPSI